MSVEVRVLGSTRALRDGSEVHLGGRKPAEVLALLAVESGRTVSSAALADRLWRGAPPASAATTLQGHVARLRRALEPARGRPRLVVSEGDGYALRGVGTDVARALALVERGREAARSGSHAQAAVLLAEAVALWSGESLLDVRDIPDVTPEAVRLDELRLTVLDEWAEAVLADGGGADLVPDLARHARAHPLRERTQSLLAQALYRAGRQADALDVLERLRRRLTEELGVDPSPEVRALQQAVLRQAPGLAVQGAGPRRAASVASADSDGFVGRQPELDLLLQAWARARSGLATFAAVTGEPGIGKTRLVEELARRTGVVPRWGRSSQTAGSPPYWPWQQILGGLPRIGEEQGDAGRWALGLEVATRLRSLTQQRPQLMVLDDLQWADADSLFVLDVVLAELRDVALLVLVTCRDEAPPAAGAVLGRLARTPGARRVSLRGLAVDEVAALVAGAVGHALDAGEAGALTTRTGGNPFFVTELAALRGGWTSGLPDSVRDVVRLRLDSVPGETRDLLDLVAVAGGELSVAGAASALGRSVPELQPPLAAALNAQLLVESSAGRLRIVHDLIRDTLMTDLDPARRAALHAALADALSSGAGAATSAAAIAVHRSEAALGGPHDVAAQACLVAAEEALDRAGDEEALELARRGLGHVTSDKPQLLADLQHVIGVATRRLGRLEESGVALAAEAEMARRTGDVRRLAQAAVASAGGGIGGYWTTFAAPFTTDVALLEEARAVSDLLDPEVRSNVLAALAVHRSARGEPGGADLARESVVAARYGGGGSALRRARVAQYVAGWTPDTAADRVELASELLRTSIGGSAVEATALHLLRAALLETGRLAESEDVSRRFAALAERRRDADLRLLQTWWQIGQHLQRGEHEPARRLADTASGDTPAVSPAAAALARTSRATVEGIAAWHEGRLVELIPTAVDLAAAVEPEWLVIQALGHAEAGHRDEAMLALSRLRGVPSAGAREPVRTVLLAEVYVTLGDVAGCAELLPVLERYGDTVVVLWPGVVALGPTALYRGSVLAVLGQTERARTELTAAVDLADRLGAAPSADRARQRLGGLITGKTGSRG